MSGLRSRRLHRSEDLGIKAIARKLGISKNTVRRALRSDEVPRYQRAPKGSIADAAEPAILEQLRLCATMPATVIAGGSAAISVDARRG